MGNTITSEHVPGSASLHMSNGLTSVVTDMLVLVGCDRAQTDWERKFVYWLVCHDQSRIGSGVVGFDVAQMGWTRDDFEAERRFVLELVDAAIAKRGWERLPYSPREDWALDALGQLRTLVSAFTADAIGKVREDDWVPAELPLHGTCEVHGVYLHEVGCIICNDVPIDEPSNAAPHRTAMP